MAETGSPDELVQRMCDGDGDAFRVVYRAVHPVLLRYLTVLVGPQDAEDVASDTWAQACRDLDRFHGDADGFRAWVTTIGRNRAMDLLRRRGRRVRADQDLTGVDVVAPYDVETVVEESLGTAEAIELIRTLPPVQAEAVWLRAVMGLDARAAAEIMGRRPGAVRSAAHRGLSTLAHRLEGRRLSTSSSGERDTFAPVDAEGVR